MSKQYYTQRWTAPQLLEAIIERVLIYVAGFLYGDEPLEDAMKRLIRANIDASDEHGFKKFNEVVKSSNIEFPFTAWGLGELEQRDDKNHYAKTGEFYDKSTNSYISILPVSFEIPMISFFRNMDDYFHARTLLNREDMSATRLDVPIMINGVEVVTYIDIGFDISQGRYTSQFREWLESGKINDVVHSITVNYWDIISDSDIQKVDDMVVSLKRLILNDEFINIPVPSEFVLVSSNPVDGDDAVSVALNVIELAFSDRVLYDSLVDNIKVTPDLLFNLDTSVDGKVVYIELKEPLEAGIEYEIEVMEGLKNVYYHPLVEGAKIKFKVEVL